MQLIKSGSNTQIQCVRCNDIITLPLPMEEIEDGVKDVSRNIQKIFPTLTAGQREMLMTGTCDTCWSNMFSEE